MIALPASASATVTDNKPPTTLVAAIRKHLLLPGETLTSSSLKTLTQQDRDDLRGWFNRDFGYEIPAVTIELPRNRAPEEAVA